MCLLVSLIGYVFSGWTPSQPPTTKPDQSHKNGRGAQPPATSHQWSRLVDTKKK